jgi:hypothetical protein
VYIGVTFIQGFQRFIYPILFNLIQRLYFQFRQDECVFDLILLSEQLFPEPYQHRPVTCHRRIELFRPDQFNPFSLF